MSKKVSVTGAKRCNTDPAKCIELCQGVKVVNFHIDSLYISFDGKLKEGVLEYLEVMKQEASKCDAPRLGFQNEETRLIIQPFGTRGYSYLLDGEDFNIKIGRGNVGPCIYAEIRAHFLYTVGYENACNFVMETMKAFTEEGSFIVSRVDICVDLVGWQPTRDLDDRIVTRAKKKDVHFNGSELTGFSFGKGGAISCRIYNKSVEIVVKGSKWVEEIWKQVGWDDDWGPGLEN